LRVQAPLPTVGAVYDRPQFKGLQPLKNVGGHRPPLQWESYNNSIGHIFLQLQWTNVPNLHLKCADSTRRSHRQTITRDAAMRSSVED
jgi:hypothetical protein